MTGFEAYAAFRYATRDLGGNVRFTLNRLDVYELAKLSQHDLRKLGYGRERALTVSQSLGRGELAAFGLAEGLHLDDSSSAKRLLASLTADVS